MAAPPNGNATSGFFVQPVPDPADRPMGWVAILRTMARSNRLIKLNRANENRANLAWGMDSS